MPSLKILILLIMLVPVREAWSLNMPPIVCAASCVGRVVSCYAAAGLTFGAVTAGAGIPAAAWACNVAFGLCFASCSPRLASDSGDFSSQRKAPDPEHENKYNTQD